MTVSDIFQTETPKLISLFFEKFDEPEDQENSGFVSQDEDGEDKEKVEEKEKKEEKEKEEI